MGLNLATDFLPCLVEQTAVCLITTNPREFAEQRIVARTHVEALRRAHAAVLTSISGVRAALADLAADKGDRPAMDGLARALESLRTRRRADVSWLDLYCTTSEAIESVNFRSSRALSKLNEDQLAVVLALAGQACAYLEINYNRDLEVAGMALTCDRLVEQGIASEADRFRVGALRSRMEQAEQDVAANGERWFAAFEAMAIRLEQDFAVRMPLQTGSGRGALLYVLGQWLGRSAASRGEAAPNEL